MLTAKQCYRIAAETGVDPRTVKRIYAGVSAVRNASRIRVTEAAEKLDLPKPPEPSPVEKRREKRQKKGTTDR